MACAPSQPPPSLALRPRSSPEPRPSAQSAAPEVIASRVGALIERSGSGDLTVVGVRARFGRLHEPPTFDQIFEFASPLTQAEGVAAPVRASVHPNVGVYSYFDGNRSWIRAVDVAQGRERVVLETLLVVRAFAYDFKRSQIYLALSDREGVNQGIFRFEIGGRSDPQLVIEPTSPWMSDPTSGEQDFLTVSDTSQYLIHRICDGSICRSRWFDTATLELRGVNDALGHGVVLGTTADVWVTTSLPLEGPCMTQPCGVSVVRFQSGVVDVVAEVCQGQVVLASLSGRPHLVYASRHRDCGHPTPEFLTRPLDGGQVVGWSPTRGDRLVQVSDVSDPLVSGLAGRVITSDEGGKSAWLASVVERQASELAAWLVDP